MVLVGDEFLYAVDEELVRRNSDFLLQLLQLHHNSTLLQFMDEKKFVPSFLHSAVSVNRQILGFGSLRVVLKEIAKNATVKVESLNAKNVGGLNDQIWEDIKVVQRAILKRLDKISEGDAAEDELMNKLIGVKTGIYVIGVTAFFKFRFRLVFDMHVI
jgi:hypothetical protein